MTGGWGGTESWVRNLKMRLYDYPRAGQRGFHRVRQVTEEDWAPAGGQHSSVSGLPSLCVPLRLPNCLRLVIIWSTGSHL